MIKVNKKLTACTVVGIVGFVMFIYFWHALEIKRDALKMTHFNNVIAEVKDVNGSAAIIKLQREFKSAKDNYKMFYGFELLDTLMTEKRTSEAIVVLDEIGTLRVPKYYRRLALIHKASIMLSRGDLVNLTKVETMMKQFKKDDPLFLMSREYLLEAYVIANKTKAAFNITDNIRLDMENPNFIRAKMIEVGYALQDKK